MLDPIQRRRYGITAILLSIVFLSVSAAAGVGNAIRRDAVVKEIEATAQDCENRIKILGGSITTKTETKIVIEWPSLEGGYTLMGDASAAAMACPGWDMREFCMGQECQNSGASMVMGRSVQD